MASSSKKNKLGKLKRAAREHLDETIGGRGPGPDRPQSDMRDFMQSMSAPENAAGEKNTTQAGPGEPEMRSGESPVKNAAQRPNESSALEKSAAALPQETLVEVDSDRHHRSSADGHTPGAAPAAPGEPSNAGAESPPEIELPNGGQTPAYPGKAAQRPERLKSMPKTRDSIYNVSSDIRLEDYTEGNGGSGGGGRMGTIAKIGGVIVLLAVLGWGGQQLMFWLDAPSYRITVANELIDESNATSLAESPALVLSSSAPVHIRFDWEEGDLTTDFLRIEILHAAGGQVEAAQERRPPLTANYVYFMGPLDPGSYRIRVLDREQVLLVERDFRVN
ncbi:MAG: hypothetical protein RIF32_01455 [Leptospirales bacterium]